MDSGIKKIAIISSLAAIVVVVCLVLLYDREQNTPQNSIGARERAAEKNIEETGADSNRVGDDLSAFLRDDYFFDPIENTAYQNASDRTKKLSLSVTSVEKDIRVQIVNPDQELVSGTSFLVEVEGVGEFKDLDRDGMIYIGDLTAGEYVVRLKNTEGYIVPSYPTRIRVKEKLEYRAIDGISVLIKTEKEIDAQAEDTGIQNAAEEADKTEIKELQTSVQNASLGIDVSKWNGKIDWDKVKNEGIDFAIMRAGYRGSVSGVIVEDPSFQTYMTGASSALIQKGVYFFTQAVNEVEAVEEASAVIELIKKYKLDYPVYIDTESAGGEGRADSLDKETRTLICEAFCRTIENAGYAAGIYASRNWFDNNLNADRLSKYQIWLAEYRDVPLYQGYYHMWQYTSKGTVSGIAGSVDLNISYEQ